MVKTILFPSSFLDRKQIDEDMINEYNACLKTGLFDVVIFGYDEWFNNHELKISNVPEEMTETVYRGWMMKPEDYSDFYEDLLKQNVRLVTTPEMYERMHIFPNVYPEIEKDTARTLTCPLYAQIDINAVKQQFPRFMVKDYVKSVKGTEFPPFFGSEITQEEFDKWMEVFYQYRSGLLTGGICIKEYLDLKKYTGRTNEYRVFYVDHKVLSICRNSLQERSTAEPPKELIEKYCELGSIFYTLDFAELEDGSWKIIEAGDGSVSGLSNGQNYERFFSDLYHTLN